MKEHAARGTRFARDLASARAAAREFRTAPLEPGPAFDYVSSYARGNIRPQPLQIREEILALLEAVRELEPRRVVEIGTAAGGTLFLFTRVAASDAALVTVDLPRGGPFGGGYARSSIPLLRSFARPGQRIELVRRDSQQEETAREVARRAGGPVDFLFLDGDHRYDGVRRDYELYEPLVRPGGLVALHDVADAPPELVGDVPRFWRELVSSGLDTREIVAGTPGGGYGIGLIRKPLS
jgi:predicted O-methyltransferase YrrM